MAGARRFLLVLVLLALATAPALAQPSEPPERAASLVVYHVWPDPRAGTSDADPLSTSAAPSPTSQRLPYTRVDGIEATDPAPEGRPESALAHFREMQDVVNLRRSTGAPVRLTLDVALGVDRVDVRVLVEPAPGATPAPARVRAVLFGEGYVARVAAPAREITYGENATLAFPLDPAWDRSRLGVVAIAQTTDGEALQSATWIAGAGPTRSASRMVLVEHVTASWCEPCAPADEALALLASQIGVGEAAAASRESYLRAPTPLLYAGLLLGAAVGIALLRRRA